MITQLLCHLWGDYILQSNWMAQNKRYAFQPASIHALLYSLCFLPILWHHSLSAWAVIFGTHFLIDRYGLARYIVWAKNFLAPFKRIRSFSETMDYLRSWSAISPGPTLSSEDAGLVVEEQKIPVRVNLDWQWCKRTGNPPEAPEYLAAWLTIIVDNTLHLTINYLALRYL